MTDVARPLDVFLEQVDAFNAHDLERFLATYSLDALIFKEEGLFLRGAVELREHYATRLGNPMISCDVRSVAEFGDRWVVAHELVSDGSVITEVIATFEIVNGVIVRASLVLG